MKTCHVVGLASRLSLSFSKLATGRKPILLGLMLWLSPLPIHAQIYSIDWYKVAGGGGTSTGGVYSVSGTAGQHDAGGPLTNGVYSLTGGYWALPIAVQNTNAPTLAIVPAAPGWAVISWTPSTPGFVLQETASPSPTNWINSSSGPTNPITVPAVPPSKFYRLHKP